MSPSTRLPHLNSALGRYGYLLVVTVLAVLALACGFASSAWAVETGRIAGKVTSASGGAAIPGIEVCAEARAEDFVEECALTNSEGEYIISGLAVGEYTVAFFPPSESTLDYVLQYYNDEPSFSEATPVTVTASSTRMGINATLEMGSEIEGRVTNTGGTPIKGIEVCAESVGKIFFGRCALTNADGEYTLVGLASGSYRVLFRPLFASELNYIPQFYEGKSARIEATPVSLTAPEIKSGIDAKLADGGQISGRVTSAATNAAIGSMLVCAYPEGGEELFFAGCAQTNANGEYTLSGLASGEYEVEFTGFEGGMGEVEYVTEYYNGKYVSSEAQRVMIVAGNVVTGIDAAMEPGPEKAPTNTVLPVVSGTPVVGGTLSCSSGSWNGAPAPTFTYQWLIGGTPIPGATASTYQVQSADEGHSMACEVTAKNVVKSVSALSVGVSVPVTLMPPGEIARVLPKVTIASSKLTLSGHSKSLPLKLQCSDATCKGSVELTVKVLTKRRRGRKTISGRGTLVLAKGSFSLAAGGSATIALHLTAAGRKLLAHAKHHPLPAKLVLSLAGGMTSTKSVRVS